MYPFRVNLILAQVKRLFLTLPMGFWGFLLKKRYYYGEVIYL